MTRDDEETRFWSIGDELEPDASGQIGTGKGALEPDPGVERPPDPPEGTHGATRRDPSAARHAAEADASARLDAQATRVVRPSPPPPAAGGRNWLDEAPEPVAERPRRAPRVRRERRAVWPRVLAPVAFLAAVIVLFSLVVDSGVLSGDDAAGPTTSKPSATATAKPKAKVYVVKPGDTVSEIASKHDTTVEVLLELNPKMSSTTVNPGERIKLPQD